MNEQLWWTIAVALVAAAPGIAALLVGFRRKQGEQKRGDAAAAAKDGLLDQLQEQVTAQQETIRFLTKRVNDLEASRVREYAAQEALREEGEALREEGEALREEGEALRQEVRELRRGVQTLIQQMETERLTPAWRPAEKPSVVAAPRKTATADPATALRDRLIAKFSREEIDDLAFRVGVKPDELEGETKKARGRALVEFLKARDRLPELEALMNQELAK